MSYRTRTTIAIALVLIGLGQRTLGSASDATIVAGQPVPQAETIDFHLPSQADGSAPLIVLRHGGGSKGNSEMAPLAQTLSGRGAVVAVPTYFSGQPAANRTFRTPSETSSARSATRAAEPTSLAPIPRT